MGAYLGRWPGGSCTLRFEAVRQLTGLGLPEAPTFQGVMRRRGRVECAVGVARGLRDGLVWRLESVHAAAPRSRAMGRATDGAVGALALPGGLAPRDEHRQTHGDAVEIGWYFGQRFGLHARMG